MTKSFDMGIAGSITVSILCISVAILLRNFYKRYTRVQNRKDNKE